jgi:hypothetical protein
MGFPVRKIPEAAAWYARGLFRRALAGLLRGRLSDGIDVPHEADSMAQYERGS